MVEGKFPCSDWFICTAVAVMSWIYQLPFSLSGHRFLQSFNMNVMVETVIFLGKFLYYFAESLAFKIIPRRKKDVAGEIVLITGSGSGLGRLLAIHFAHTGAILVLWDINQENNMETCRLAKEKGAVKVFAYKCDCSNRQEVYRVADQVSWLVFFALMLKNLYCSYHALFTKTGRKAFVICFPHDLYVSPTCFCMSEV